MWNFQLSYHKNQIPIKWTKHIGDSRYLTGFNLIVFSYILFFLLLNFSTIILFFFSFILSPSFYYLLMISCLNSILFVGSTVLIVIEQMLCISTGLGVNTRPPQLVRPLAWRSSRHLCLWVSACQLWPHMKERRTLKTTSTLSTTRWTCSTSQHEPSVDASQLHWLRQPKSGSGRLNLKLLLPGHSSQDCSYASSKERESTLAPWVAWPASSKDLTRP